MPVERKDRDTHVNTEDTTTTSVQRPGQPHYQTRRCVSSDDVEVGA